MALTRPTAYQINTVSTTITDPLTVLNQGSTAANIDIGFILNRNPSANVAIVWQASSNQFILANTSSSGTTNANITVSNYANLRAGNVLATTITTTNLVGNANVTVTGSMLPSANITYDLGSPTQRWREGWFSGSTIHIGDESISVDTNGKWTFSSKGSTVNMGKDHPFDAPTATLTGNITAANFNFSNGNSIFTTINSTITTANTAMKGYADAITTAWTSNATTQLSQITAANAAIVTANTALKGYVDGQITSLVGGAPAILDTLNEIATALGNDANLSVTLTNTITTANTNMKGYVDAITTAWTSNATTQLSQITAANAAITTVTNSVTGANAAIVTANTALKGYVDGQITTVTNSVTGANAAITTVTNSVTGANAAIVTANTALKGYTDAAITTVTNSVTGANAAIVTANTALKGYTDAANTIQSNQITAISNSVTGANAAIVTANTALKGYVDAQITTLVGGAPAILDTLNEIATALGNDANLSVTLTNSINNVQGNVTAANAAIVTANTALKGYVDAANTVQSNQITAVSNSVAGANAAIVTANTAMQGYVDAVTTAWTANATTQLSQITGANAAIVTANTALKGYVDAQDTTITNSVAGANTAITTVSNSVTGANAAIVTANTAMKGYVDAVTTAWTANATTQLSQITGANAAIVTANTAMKGYVDGQITTRAALTGATFSGAVTATELFVTSPGGDEGGQLNLAPAVTNTTLVGNVTIDVYQNKLRIWEGGGTNRGGYFDLTGLSAGVGTNLAGGGGGTPGGADSQIQFNNSSTFGGAVSLRYFSGNGVVLANAAVASTSTTTGALQVSGGIGVAGNVWCGQVYSSNNGNGTNYRIGDDAWLGDVNIADTTQLMGAQNGNNGYLRFGNVGTETLGRAGSGALTWTGTFSATNINSDNHNYANGTSIITTLSSAISTANTALKGYTDAAITTVTNSVTGANAAIVTANTAMKGYADAITTAWTANAATQLNQITGANAAIVTANTALKGYTDAAITTVTNSVTGANAAIVTANTALKGYVDAQITSLVGGAPAVLDTLNEIATALGNDANLSVTLTNTITTANTNMKGYVDAANTTQSSQITTVSNSVTGANAAIVTANTAMKGYADAITTAWTANATTQLNQITGANAAITTVTNSVTGANAAITTVTNSVTGANAAITTVTNSVTGANATMVTSVTGTAPVTSSGGKTPAIGMAAATASVNGYMTSTYASKLDGIAAGATNVTNTNQLTNGAAFVTASVTLTTAAQTAITSVGTLTGLTTSGAITSTLATGTAPFTIASTTKVTNLNVDMLDGLHADTAYNSFGAGTIPVRHSSGYFYSNYFNMTADQTTSMATRIAVETGSDSFLRWQTPAQFITNSKIVDWKNHTAQLTMSGGGTVTFNGTALLWSARVIAIPAENAEYSASGYIDITCPTSGTVVYYNSANATTTVTATAAGIPLAAWEAIYYQVTEGQIYTSDQTKFRVVNYTNSTWSPGPGWLLIASRNGDDSTVRWLPGQKTIPSGGSYYTTSDTQSWAALTAKYADLAEKYVADKNYVPGTVVVFGGNKEITISSASHDPAIAGVISTNPAYLMNYEVDGLALSVALQGRVPCRVQGPINKGDCVVSSDTPGVAQRLDRAQYLPGCVIGKALEDITEDRIVTIEVVVGRV